MLKRVLESPDHRARAAAVRVLAAWLDRVASPLDLLRPRVGDEHPRVRLEAVRALSFFGPDDAAAAAELALDVLNDEMDVYLEYTLGETLRALDGGPQPAAIAHASHAAHDDDAMAVSVPRVFLDKGDRVVRYQLDRLSDVQLLMVDRATDDPRYRPVYEVMLMRPGLSRQHREEALEGLVQIDGSGPVPVLLDALTRLGEADRTRRIVARQLADLLLDRPADELTAHSGDSRKRPAPAASWPGPSPSPGS